MSVPSEHAAPADAAPTLKGRRASWSRYWQTGAIHSCAESFEGRLGEQARAFWERVFAPLHDEDRVLELGAGNGAVSRFLVETLMFSRRLEVHAVDLATLKPDWHTRLPPQLQAAVRFHSGVNIEKLPFEDSSIGCIVSQFAIEYADQEAAWSEVLRVASPFARLGMILHHRDAVPVENGVEELAHLERLLQDGGAYDQVAKLIPYASLVGSEAGRLRLQSDPDATAARDRYNSTVRQLLAVAEQSSCPDILLQATQGLAEALSLAQRQGRKAARDFLAAQHLALEDSKIRLAEIAHYALDGEQMTAVARRLVEGGFSKVDYMPLSENGHLYAWCLTAART